VLSYVGGLLEKASDTYAEPGTRPFERILHHARCGPSIEGELRILSGAIPARAYRINGRVTVAGRCCRLAAAFNGVAGTATEGSGGKMHITLCQDGGMWHSEDGVFGNTNECKGFVEIEQR